VRACVRTSERTSVRAQLLQASKHQRTSTMILSCYRLVLCQKSKRQPSAKTAEPSRSRGNSREQSSTS
jgi:hypothetical protein